jgi:hypothetical protein
VEADLRRGLSVDEAMRTWRASAWSGLFVDCELPPGESGFPEIYGTCWWYVWWYHDRWHTSLGLEYPASSVGQDERCAAWMGGFAAATSRTLDLELRADDRSLDPFTIG